jgi:hypothetical protein
MKKTIKLTESDLSRIVNRVINEQTNSPQRCEPNKLSIVKTNLFSGKPVSYKMKIENNVSAGVTNEGSSSVLFVTLGNEPTCWCKPSELM